MSVLYVWDPTEIKYKEVPYPIVRKNNKYYNSIGYRYTTKTGRYIRIWGSGNYRAAAPAIVPFPSGEWTDICNMLESHYLGFINVSAYWKIGDSRIFHIDEIPATDTMPGQPAQDIELTIVDFNKDELTSPGVFRKKAAVTLIAKNILENYSYDQLNSLDSDNVKEHKLSISRYVDGKKALYTGDTLNANVPSLKYDTLDFINIYIFNTCTFIIAVIYIIIILFNFFSYCRLTFIKFFSSFKFS